MMFFANVVQSYIPPISGKVHLLKDIALPNLLTLDQIEEITNSPYSHRNWGQLSYFVSKSAFRLIYNEDLGIIADQYITNGDWMIDETSFNCLFYETNLKHPGVSDWTHHFLFFTPDDFWGALGIYAMHLSANTSEHMALRQFANLAQYHLVSNSPFNRFMVAIQKDYNWELVFGEILPMVTSRRYTKSRKVKISLFKEPSKFFLELLSGGKAKNILYTEYDITFRI